MQHLPAKLEFEAFYKFPNENINVTYELVKHANNDIVIVPEGEHNRYVMFADLQLPLHKKKNRFPKSIIIKSSNTTYEIKHTESAILNISTGQVYLNTNQNSHPNNINSIQESYKKSILQAKKELDEHKKRLMQIQNSLILKYGSFNDEYPEQLMAITYLTGFEKILEIGGNIGRNSLILGAILKQKNNDHNMVTLEPSEIYYNKLLENRNNNNLNFKVENAALSKRNLIQKKCDTIVSDVVLEGYEKVNCIDWNTLIGKYQINFDTLIIDCEGAFYYILLDMPEILQNIKMVIMENDYMNIKHKKTVDKILKHNNFEVIYRESGGWGCCFAKFYEIWRVK